MANISNLEIFGVGTHYSMDGTKITIAEKDLEDMVSAFNELSGTNIVKPHLKIGHTDAQKWFGQKDGIPSLGWIDKVWRVGGKLLADVRDVPNALIDMIRQGRYHNVSAEVYLDSQIEHNGKKFPSVLSAVSLLGVEMPAVKDLAGLANALFQSEPIHQFKDGKATSLEIKKETTGMFTQEQVDNLISAAVTTAVGEIKQEFAAKIGDLETQLKVVTTAKDNAIAEIEVVRASAAAAEATALVDNAIKEGKLLPKQRDFAVAALSANDTKLKFGGSEKSMASMFKDFLEAQGKVTDTGEHGSGKNKKVEYSNAADEVDQKSRALMAADTAGKMTYQVAMGRVLADEPELKQRYHDMAQ